MTKKLNKEVRAKILDNPKHEEGMLFIIFNNPNFKALCALLLLNNIREIVFAELLKDPLFLFRLQFT